MGPRRRLTSPASSGPSYFQGRHNRGVTTKLLETGQGGAKWTKEVWTATDVESDNQATV